MAQPHHRHQASLESVIDFSNTTASLSTTERSQATLTFDRIINYSSSHEPPKLPGDAGREYERAKLIKLIYDHAISDAGRDSILRYFLTYLVTNSTELEEFPRVLSNVIDFDEWSVSKKGSIVERVQYFADHLVDGFFIPRGSHSPKHTLQQLTLFFTSKGFIQENPTTSSGAFPAIYCCSGGNYSTSLFIKEGLPYT